MKRGPSMVSISPFNSLPNPEEDVVEEDVERNDEPKAKLTSGSSRLSDGGGCCIRHTSDQKGVTDLYVSLSKQTQSADCGVTQ